MTERSILIADDEPSIRRGLRSIIEREIPGWSVVAEAADGETAAERIRNDQPRIVILDIKMPKLSGLDIVRAVKDEGLSTSIIILSGYDDYSFVREALKHGAVDYLLKPVENAELTEVISQIDSQLVAETERQQEISQLRTQAEDGLGANRNRLWSEILRDGEAGFDSHRDQTRQLGIPVRARFHVLVATVFDSEGVDFRARRDIEQIALETAEALAPLSLIAPLLDYRPGRLGVLVAQAIEDREETVFADILSKARPVLSERSESGYACVRTGLSSPFFDLAAAAESYEEALQLSKCAFYHRPALIGPDHSCAFGRLDRQRADEAVERIIQSVEIGSEENATAAALGLTSQIIAARLDPNRAVRAFDRAQMQAVLSVAELETFEIVPIPRSHIDHSKRAFVAATQSMAEHCANHSGDHTYRRIKAAETYVERHFREDISLEEVAERIGWSPNYFSTRFREQTGVTFRRYVTRMRVETACRLLVNSDESVVEVGRRVGYEESVSFHRAFKRIMALSPQDYRNHHRDV